MALQMDATPIPENQAIIEKFQGLIDSDQKLTKLLELGDKDGKTGATIESLKASLPQIAKGLQWATNETVEKPEIEFWEGVRFTNQGQEDTLVNDKLARIKGKGGEDKLILPARYLCKLADQAGFKVLEGIGTFTQLDAVEIIAVYDTLSTKKPYIDKPELLIETTKRAITELGIRDMREIIAEKTR